MQLSDAFAPACGKLPREYVGGFYLGMCMGDLTGCYPKWGRRKHKKPTLYYNHRRTTLLADSTTQMRGGIYSVSKKKVSPLKILQYQIKYCLWQKNDQETIIC